MGILQGLWLSWWRAQWRGTLGVALASIALLVPRQAAAQFCNNCIYNQPSLQTAAGFNVQTGTVAGQFSVGTLVAAALNIGSITATSFTGNGALLTSLNASALGSGTVPSARMAGPYTGITGVGTVAAGTWQGSKVTPAFGGTGSDLSLVAAGGVPYFLNGGTIAALTSPSGPRVLMTAGSGAAPVWTSSPTLTGQNFSLIPLAALDGNALPTHVIVSTNSIPQTNGAGVLGNIPGGAAFLTVPLPIANLAGGTLPTSNAASSVTVTGVSPGTFGGPSQMFQARIGADGRVYDVHQFNLVVPPPTISTGPLPAGVTIGAPAITSGTLAGDVVASSVAASGIAPGTYGGAAKALTVAYLIDGRASAITQQNIALPLAQLNSGALPGGITLGAAQLTPGTWPSNVPVSSVAASGVTAGTCGGPGTVCAPTFGADGRATGFAQYAIPGVSTNSVQNNVDNGWLATQTFFSSVTIHGNLGASGSVTAASFSGSGAGLVNLSPNQMSAGIFNTNVVASSVAIPFLTVPGSVTASAFFGDGSHLHLSSVIPGAFTFQSSVTLSGAVAPGGLLVKGDSVTASAFFGDGSHLTGITASFSGGDVASSTTFHNRVLSYGKISAWDSVPAFNGDTPAAAGVGQISAYNHTGAARIQATGLNWAEHTMRTTNGTYNYYGGMNMDASGNANYCGNTGCITFPVAGGMAVDAFGNGILISTFTAAGDLLVPSSVTASGFVFPRGEGVTLGPTSLFGGAPAQGIILGGSVIGVANSTNPYAGSLLAGDVTASGVASNTGMSGASGIYSDVAGFRGATNITGGNVTSAEAMGKQATGRASNASSVNIGAGTSDGNGANVTINAGLAGGSRFFGGSGNIFAATGDNLGGESFGSNVATATTAGTETISLTINGEAVGPLTIGAHTNNGPAIAADLQAQVRAITPGSPANAYAYNGFFVNYITQGPNHFYDLIVPGDPINFTIGAVVVGAGTLPPLMKIGVANGGQEFGTGNVGTYKWVLGQGNTPDFTSGMELDTLGLHVFSGGIDTVGNIAPLNGTVPIYRCLTSGTNLAGTLTSDSATCGTFVDTGFRTP